jgi:hypothetical protein
MRRFEVWLIGTKDGGVAQVNNGQNSVRLDSLFMNDGRRRELVSMLRSESRYNTIRVWSTQKTMAVK